MSNRDLCISIINDLKEEQLANVAVMLQSVKNLVNEALDDAYCLELYNDYLSDPDPEKNEAVSIQDYAEGLGITLL